MTRIHAIDVWDARFPFRDGPYAMSHVTQDATRGRIFRLETEDGGFGLGEAAFPPSVPAAAVDAVLEAEERTLSALIGLDIDAALAAVVPLARGAKPERAVAFGLETALFDARARALGEPLSALLGGARAKTVPDYLSISERTPEAVAQRLNEHGGDYAVIQLKLGVGDFDHDAALVRAALRFLGQRQTLLADANGGWTADRAYRMAGALRDRRIVWEEPTSDYTVNAAIAGRIKDSNGARIMADQCVADPATAQRAVVDRAVWSICIKPAFNGGLRASRTVRDAAVAAAMPMRIDGPWCGDIATAAILHLAVGATPRLLVAGCDLREPLVLDPDLGGAVIDAPGRVGPPPGPGLGIADVADRLGPADARYA
jgi:L-alanine-DL-glutamate epimerase-like enolase superfamily enzyme